MSVWSCLRLLMAIAAISIAGSACGTGAPSASGGSTASAASAASAASVASETAATASVRPSSTAGTPPRSSPIPSASSQPPAATLAADGGDPIAGQLGTYTWGDGGSDSPWLPGTPIAAGSGEPLTLSIGGGVAVAGWSAGRVPMGTTDGAGAIALGSGAPPVTFKAPASGTWSVQVSVSFADRLGSATWYWQLAVR